MASLRRTALAFALAAAVGAILPLEGSQAQPAALSSVRVAERACAVLGERVDRVPGLGPLFLASYDDPGAPAQLLSPALAGAAFTYDNALAVIALVGCDRAPQALRIAEALRRAVVLDRLGEANGRLRNTYRAGPVGQGPVPPMGWWDTAAGAWREDAYQVGSATGNVAWAGLALLTAAAAGGGEPDRAAAVLLARWVIANTRDQRADKGFTGGVDGFDGQERPLTWKSTEHNTDLAALFSWLGERDGQWREPAGEARDFLAAMWAAGRDHFPVGTAKDGITINRSLNALDVQVWPQLLRDADPAWRIALTFAQTHLAVAGGYDFNDDRDGLWVEGTAQMALVKRLTGDHAGAEALFASLGEEFSPSGYLWATREPSVSTGLAIGPDSHEADFFYYHVPHLAPTAWAAMAGRGWNPFQGRMIKP